MNKEFLGLRTVAYYVSDLEMAKNWYSKVFDTKPYFDEPFYVGFNIEGYELGLMPEEKAIINKTTTLVVYCGVSDIQKSYDRLLKLGAKILEAPQHVGGEIRVATVKDPWDNVIGIIYNPDFKL